MRPGLEPASSEMLVRFVSVEPRQELWAGFLLFQISWFGPGERKNDLKICSEGRGLLGEKQSDCTELGILLDCKEIQI